MSEEAAVATDPVAPRKPRYPWTSGWCVKDRDGNCSDGRTTNKAGEVIRRCLYVGVNGEKVKPREVYCACECHGELV